MSDIWDELGKNAFANATFFTAVGAVAAGVVTSLVAAYALIASKRLEIEKAAIEKSLDLRLAYFKEVEDAIDGLGKGIATDKNKEQGAFDIFLGAPSAFSDHALLWQILSTKSYWASAKARMAISQIAWILQQVSHRAVDEDAEKRQAYLKRAGIALFEGLSAEVVALRRRFYLDYTLLHRFNDPSPIRRVLKWGGRVMWRAWAIRQEQAKRTQIQSQLARIPKGE